MIKAAAVADAIDKLALPAFGTILVTQLVDCGRRVAFAILVLLLWQMLRFAWGWLDWQFLTSFDSQLSPHKAGVKAALVGSLYLIGLTTLFAVPLGVGAAIYLEEYGQRSPWRGFVQMNIANLAGVPSIVYGILGLGLFVRYMQMGPSVLAGALTLSLVVLPIIILAAQEALRAVVHRGSSAGRGFRFRRSRQAGMFQSDTAVSLTRYASPR